MDKTPTLYIATIALIGLLTCAVLTTTKQEQKNQQLAKERAALRQQAEANAEAFHALPATEHLRLAAIAFQTEHYSDMESNLADVDPNDPTAKRIKAAYIARINANSEQRAKEAKTKRAKEKAENKMKVPEIGMDSETLYECKWGIPNRINRTKTVYGESEQWVYTQGYKMKCVYVKDGIVTAIQD